MGLIALLACRPAPTDSPAPLTEDALAVYTRASIDLRGVRPSVDEAEALLADPATLDAALDALPADPRFGWSVATLFAPLWQTRADESDVGSLDLAMADETAFLASVGEEPLRLVAHVADEDLPWTDIVRADWTMADPLLAARYPVDYPADGAGWQVVHYTDGRPTAGVLSTNGLWWRYRTTYNNANRGRVNAISRILLCKDYLEAQVSFPANLDLTDEQALRDAVRTNPSCVACHGAIDPVSAYLWGFYSEFSEDPTDWAYYHPDREDHWKTFGVPPGYFGQPGDTIDDLGRQMAGDHRLVECAVQRAYEGLLQRAVTLDDDAALVAHREAFLGGGGTLRALFASIVRDEAYRATDGDDAPYKLASPDQFATLVEDLTGYRLALHGHDAMATDYGGLRSMAGGSRSVAITAPVPTPTGAEVRERIAQAATADLGATPQGAALLDGLTFTETPDEDHEAMAQVVTRLHLRVLSEVVDPASVEDELALWQALVDAGATPEQAWAGLVEALLRDPAFVVY